MAAPGGAGALVISLDFELFWGMRDVVSLAAYRANLEGSAAAIRATLELFEDQQIHATWACVGLVFAGTSEEARRLAPSLRPRYRAPGLSPYAALERGEPDVDPACYFAPEALALIRRCPHQEIGTHTFSHYYCNEPGQTAAQFDADLGAAVAQAVAWGLTLRSLVFPRNQCNPEYLPILTRHGITAYRGREAPAWLFEPSDSRVGTTVRRAIRLADHYAPLVADTARPGAASRGPGPLNLPGTRFLRPYDPRLRHLDGLRLHRMQAEMTRAAEAGRVYHLWWHPHNFGVHTGQNLAFLAALLRHAKTLAERFGFRSLSMGELAS